MKLKRSEIDAIFKAQRQLLAPPATGRNASKPAARLGTKGKWPIECVSLGGDTASIPKLRATLQARGVRCDISADGNPIATSQKHQNEIARALGFVNKDRYY